MIWTTQRLEEVADFSLGKMLDQEKNRGELLPYLANVNVRWGEFDLENLRSMRFEANEFDRFSLKAGDIVMCEGGEPGRCAIWKEQRSGMMYQKALHRIRTHECLDSSYLFYYFLDLGLSGGFAPFVTGAAIKHLPKEQLAKVEVRYPDLPTQKLIASVLSGYDDLIETNRRRIALLEESARLLYREWFVKLRFPGHELVEKVDGVPAGWKRKNLYDVAELTMGYPFQSNLFNAEGKGKPAIRIRDIPDVTAATWTTETPPSKDYEVVRGDFLIGMDGIFHMNHWVGVPGWLVQRVCRVRAKDERFRGFLALALHDPIKHFEATISGATVAHLGAKHLKTIEILVPPTEHEDLLRILNDLLDQRIQLFESNMMAKQARDALLPKLMSGQLTV